MRSRWNDADAAREAARTSQPLLGERVYTSRLLGAERALVLHGGGNTSVKSQGLLYVKGSGSDLASVKESDFSVVRLDQAAALIERPDLDNAALREAVAQTAARPGPGASIETLMHALLPWPFVEHTHADAILAVANTVNGTRIAAELFGELAPLVPFHPSGFALAKACLEVYRTQASAGTIGLILLHHGVVAFGRSARESYENMLALVTRAEHYLESKGAWQLPVDPRPFSWDVARIARLRRDVSHAAGFPLLLAAQEGETWQAFARRADLEALCAAGPATPQHAVFLRAQAMAGTDIDAFAQRYGTLVRAAHPDIEHEVAGFDFAPRVIVDPELGAWVAAIDPAHLHMAAEILQQDLEIKSRASTHDRYEGLPPGENIDAEIQYGGQERRLRARGGPATRLLGEAVLISARDGNEAPCSAYARAGAGVVHDGSLAAPELVRDAVRRFGGIDVLVLDSPDIALLDAAAPALTQAPRGGRVVAAGFPASVWDPLARRCRALGLTMGPALEASA
jgi:rhamnose utilization protein RhaD (predicted bifunctional aldolase and dehydrogenase)